MAHTHRHVLGSALTQIFLRGMNDVQGYIDLSDLWINLRHALTRRQAGDQLFVDVYWSGADNAGHAYGTENEYVPSALRHFGRSFEEDFLSILAPEARKNTLLVIAADHGQIATPAEQIVRLPNHPRLEEALLLPPAGESRAAYLYERPGQKGTVAAYAGEYLAQHFVALDTERALETGLWGETQEITPAMRVRLGDTILVARESGRLSTRKEEEDKSPLRGHHGSPTPQEMLVPLIMVRLDEL
jgi:hypothetical protein